jgi:hypothetical protein
MQTVIPYYTRLRWRYTVSINATQSIPTFNKQRKWIAHYFSDKSVIDWTTNNQPSILIINRWTDLLTVRVKLWSRISTTWVRQATHNYTVFLQLYIFCTRASLILIYTNWLKLTINTDAYIFEYIEQEIRKCGTAGLLQALTKLCWEKFHWLSGFSTIIHRWLPTILHPDWLLLRWL